MSNGHWNRMAEQLKAALLIRKLIGFIVNVMKETRYVFRGTCDTRTL